MTTLNIHNITRISVEPVGRRYHHNGDSYVNRGLMIETEQGRFTIELFSDDEAKLALTALKEDSPCR